MERALNLEFLTYTKCEDLNDLMEAQMAFLVSRFDILLEAICAVSGSEQFSRSHLFVRSHRFGFCFSHNEFLIIYRTRTLLHFDQLPAVCLSDCLTACVSNSSSRPCSAELREEQ